jgi:hypothetical protein
LLRRFQNASVARGQTLAGSSVDRNCQKLQQVRQQAGALPNLQPVGAGAKS